MKTTFYIFGKIREKLHSKEFLETSKLFPTGFLRIRVLTFPILVLFILNLLRKSIPKELNSFCDYCEQTPTSRSAFTQARAKLNSCAFTMLNEVLIEEFYDDNEFQTLYDLTILAIDGSTLQLPDSHELMNKFGSASNQTTKKMPMARISHLYDAVNCITWDAKIAPYDASERDLAIQHFECIKLLNIDLTKILVIFDRGYPSLALIVYLLKNEIKFLMRCANNFLSEIVNVVNSGKKNEVIKISLTRASRAAKTELKKNFPDLDFNEDFFIRVVVVTLSTGEKEILITSLTDKEKYPYRIFIDLYFKRWGIEESYKFYKCCLEIENFSGKTCLAIEQDFHATVLASNAHALLALEAAQELIESKEKSLFQDKKKYAYAINKNVSMDNLKNKFVGILLDLDADIEKFCTNEKKSMKKNLIAIRPGRSFERKVKNPHRKFHANQR